MTTQTDLNVPDADATSSVQRFSYNVKVIELWICNKRLKWNGKKTWVTIGWISTAAHIPVLQLQSPIVQFAHTLSDLGIVIGRQTATWICPVMWPLSANPVCFNFVNSGKSDISYPQPPRRHSSSHQPAVDWIVWISATASQSASYEWSGVMLRKIVLNSAVKSLTGYRGACSRV